jgi:hypothetical protein
MIPRPSGAGRMRMVTDSPVCNPIPLNSTGDAIVCSYVRPFIRFGGKQSNDLYFNNTNKELKVWPDL